MRDSPSAKLVEQAWEKVYNPTRYEPPTKSEPVTFQFYKDLVATTQAALGTLASQTLGYYDRMAMNALADVSVFS